jgi:hypothetical protein
LEGISDRLNGIRDLRNDALVLFSWLTLANGFLLSTLGLPAPLSCASLSFALPFWFSGQFFELSPCRPP